MVNRMLAGETALSLVKDTSVPEQTLHRKKHHSVLKKQGHVTWIRPKGIFPTKARDAFFLEQAHQAGGGLSFHSEPNDFLLTAS